MKCPKCHTRSMSYYAVDGVRYLFCKCGHYIDLGKKIPHKRVLKKKPKRFVFRRKTSGRRNRREIRFMMNFPGFTFDMIEGVIVSKLDFIRDGEGDMRKHLPLGLGEM